MTTPVIVPVHELLEVEISTSNFDIKTYLGRTQEELRFCFNIDGKYNWMYMWHIVTIDNMIC